VARLCSARHQQRQRGTVIVAVTLGVFVLSVMAFALSALVRTSTEELRARKEQLQAHYVARGAIYRTLPLLTGPATADAKFRPGQRSLAWSEAGLRVALAISDENGKLDVNAAPPKVLERLFTNLGESPEAARSLAAAIEDWRDADDEARLGGAERSYYMALPHPYRPANEDFRSVEELLLVRGVTPELFWGKYEVRRDGSVMRRLGLVDCLTVYGRQATININYAPEPVLRAAPMIDDRVVGWMMEGRQKHPFESVSQFVHDYPVLLSEQTLGALTAASSGRYAVVASATSPSGVTARVRAVVQVSGFDLGRRPDGRRPLWTAPPFWILEWNDSYVQ
jgi:general secretion pathway protein K